MALHANSKGENCLVVGFRFVDGSGCVSDCSYRVLFLLSFLFCQISSQTMIDGSSAALLFLFAFNSLEVYSTCNQKYIHMCMEYVFEIFHQH